MDTLKNFLNPIRKENIKFVLSDAFIDDEGNPLEWEMRQLSGREGIDLSRETADLNGVETMAYYVAAALVTPNLKSKEIVDAFAERYNGKIMQPHEILMELVTDGELGELMNIYGQQNRVTKDFRTLVDEAKN